MKRVHVVAPRHEEESLVGAELIATSGKWAGQRCLVLNTEPDKTGGQWVVAGLRSGDVGIFHVPQGRTISRVPTSEMSSWPQELRAQWQASWGRQMSAAHASLDRMAQQYREEGAARQVQRAQADARAEAEKQEIVRGLNYKAGVRKELLRIVGRK